MDDSTRPSDAPTMLGRDTSGGVPPDAATVLSGSTADDAPTYASPASAAGRPWPRGPRPSPGQAFGPYVITRPLGSGGMGDVYEALHSEHGRRVALKVLGHRLSGPADVARFLREGELAASLTHSNTVYVYGSEEIDGSPVISMELLPGGTLRDLVDARGPLPPREAVDLILQVIAGLGAAEAAGILHRDIKPANCFVDRDGAVKVGDFGLSISTKGREGAATGSFQGTPQFAPPEQIRGEALDVRADIYAVGATLFYLLTGKPPFDDADLTTLISRVQAETARLPREMRAGVPEALALGVFASFALQRASVDLVPLANSLDRLTAIQPPGHDADAPERAALEVYVAGRFRPLIADEVTWSMMAGTKRLINYRALAMRVAREHPTVTADDLADATTRLGPFAQAQDKDRTDAIRRGRISFAVMPTFLFVAGFAVAAGVGVVLAVVLGGGLLMRLFGIAVVTRRGERASRLRIACRALAAWLPAAGFAGGMWIAGVTYANDMYHARSPAALVAAAVSLVIFLVGALWAALRPARGPQDYLAGTWLVPR